MRRLVVLAALLALTGCGAPATGEHSDYCQALKGKAEFFGDLANGSPVGLVTGLPTLESLGAQAPEDLTDEWQTFLNGVRGLSDALDRAHVKPSDFASRKLDTAQAKAISDAADVLTSPEVVAAANGIEQQARDVCHVQLGL